MSSSSPLDSPLRTLFDSPLRTLFDSPLRTLFDSPLRTLFDSPLRTLFDSPLVCCDLRKAARVSFSRVLGAFVYARGVLSNE